MVWSLYNEVLRHHDLQKVPLEIHQGVLRKCSPPPEEMRKTLALKIARKDMRYDYHPFEPRFQTIIRNIRAAGYEPELDDFHIILQQFAAVGHHRAAMQVLQEITHSGIQRAPKTFGLCLQALCHRLTLPVWHEHRETIVAEVARYCTRLLAQMAEENVGFTSANVDLTIRVLKETMDLDAFERLMRYAYGIDLRYPDRAPLEDWQSDSGPLANVASPKPPSAIAPSQRLPFSTDALNTTIDMLGRHQQISILVQAFEVLTSPLPPGANETSAFDDEDDFGVSEPNVTTFQRPSARPNKMSYHMLLKWISRADHAVFLRHYTLQAMKLYHAEDRRLRGDCMRIIGPETLADDSVPEGAELKLPKDIRPPRFTVDRNLLLPAFAYAKRNKDMELLRWIFWNSCRVLRKKRTDIKFYSEVCAVWEARDKERAAAERAALMLNNVEVSSDVFSESAASPATNIEAKSAAESATETEALPTDVVATPEPTVAEGSHPLISAFLGSAPPHQQKNKVQSHQISRVAFSALLRSISYILPSSNLQHRPAPWNVADSSWTAERVCQGGGWRSRVQDASYKGTTWPACLERQKRLYARS
ncbi:hypothetical protein CERSUDRAFT_111156 [Gelatoporia subvermispora B]|uniref:Uncharacterized protein n=1 Tax=Ceriporiopsis subvermispora (strain B) TaxID=914234 RepID=M2QU19_CERS8|nr:hypothetical protein CERSUDRAFT_111156 [Gelatoporia subvermispora B]